MHHKNHKRRYYQNRDRDYNKGYKKNFYYKKTTKYQQKRDKRDYNYNDIVET